ncbi:MAG TPA: choice-of-anchor tandem repeat GloVer-containing protein, partial [Verrucomicrobiae bacterium]
SATGTLAWMYSFTGTIDGASPEAALVQGSYGYFYGTTYGGDSGSDPQTYGTVFKINTNGAFASLHSFTGHDGGDGGRSKAALVQGSDGNFYGTTVMGGTNGGGTVFKISANGVLTTLYSFTGSNDGSSPWAGLVQGSDGYFYGTTLMGTVFKISATGTLAWVYKFSGSDGAIPVAALVQGSDGNFYGTTSGGGTNGFGTVFKISATGTLTSLYSFTGRNYDGGNPEAGLVEGSDGYFYGTTSTGGTNDGGTVFKISTNGALTYLYSFTGGADGAAPFAGLVQGSDGYFYGTTSIGGSKNGWSGGAGTVFRISTKGVLTTLYSFTGGDDGGNPVAGLVQGSDGSFYGTTQNNGEGGGGGVFSYDHGPGGTVFRLTLGSGPASGSLVVSTSSLPNGTNGIAYSQTLSASGGKTPYTWTTSLGALPRGLTLAANGVLSGTPMTYGTFNFTVQVTDALSATATQSLVLQIMPQPAMGITTSGNQILLSWPTNAAGYILQSTTNLSSGIWSDVTSGITVVDTNYVFTSTPNGNAAFFRLKQ